MAAVRNGPAQDSVMYKLNPQYKPIDPTDIPSDVMYKLKNIQTGKMEVACDSSCNGVEQSPVVALEARQEAILKKLVALQTEVDKLEAQSKTDISTPISGTCLKVSGISESPIEMISGVVEDIVISANPKNPPLSLLVLYQLLKSQYRVMIATHIHSSVKHVPEIYKSAFKNGAQGPRSQYQIALTLIWKDVKNGPTLMVSPRTQTQLEGEASMARYLGRMMQPAYDACDPVLATLVDKWLDVATVQVLRGNTKEKASALKSLNSALGKSDWLVGNSLTLADIVLWSALQQTGQAESAPGNVKRWLKACSDQAMFQMATSLLPFV